MALELSDVAERMYRQRLKRETPDLSDEALDRAVDVWLAVRPGAEQGDASGIPVPWPRPRR